MAYIVVGVLLGPHVFGFIRDQDILERFGDIGLILLLFFVGMEISFSRFSQRWRFILFGSALQVLFSVPAALVLRFFSDWSIAQIVLLGFVLSLSSTAVLLKYLDERGLMHSKIGLEITGILIV